MTKRVLVVGAGASKRAGERVGILPPPPLHRDFFRTATTVFDEYIDPYAEAGLEDFNGSVGQLAGR